MKLLMDYIIGVIIAVILFVAVSGIYGYITYTQYMIEINKVSIEQLDTEVDQLENVVAK